MEIPNNLLGKIDEVIGYIGTSTTDYLLVKRQLLNVFPSQARSLFSQRHPCTKKHILNSFDEAVIDYWHQKTGIRLFVDKLKMHNPDWSHKKKGWTLYLLNEERKRHDGNKKNL